MYMYMEILREEMLQRPYNNTCYVINSLLNLYYTFFAFTTKIII